MEAKRMYNVCCSIIFLAAFFSVALGQRKNDGYISYKCLDGPKSSQDKPPVIMLHGTADAKATWDGIYQKIPMLTGRKVCIYDLRNNGDSSWSNNYTVDCFAQDLGFFMDSMNIEKASLVGHDIGALVVMRYALNNPHRVESVFVEDMSPRGVDEEVVDGFRQFFRAMLESIAAVSPLEDRKTIVQAVKKSFIRITGEPLPEYLFNSFPFRRCNGRWQWKTNIELVLRAIDDLPALLGTNEGVFNGPVYFIHGSESQFRILEDVEFIRMLFPKAEIFVVEGADHYVHQNLPELFTEKLIEFLNRAGPQKYATMPCSGSDEIPKQKPLHYGGKPFFRRDKFPNPKPLYRGGKQFYRSDWNGNSKELEYDDSELFV